MVTPDALFYGLIKIKVRFDQENGLWNVKIVKGAPWTFQMIFTFIQWIT